MIENCLRHKIIRDFLKHYTENRWKDLIPSLIEIGILNLQKSFNKIFFTNEELKKVLRHLQISQIEKDKEKNKEKEYKDINNKENERILYNKNSKEKENGKDEKMKFIQNQSRPNETPKSYINGSVGSNNKVINIYNNNIKRMKMIDSTSNNKDKKERIKYSVETINEVKNNIKNNYHYFKNNISIDFKNKLSRQRGEYYKKIQFENKNKINQKKHIDKISYVISYDKNLRPASISRKINSTHNNTNNINLKTDNDIFKVTLNYSTEKKSKNNSKSKSKNKYHKNKEKLLNLNLNNLNRINNMKNVRRKHYNLGKSNNKVDILHTGGNENNNYYNAVVIRWPSCYAKGSITK